MQPCYSMHMRTTISLDDQLAEAVRLRAAERGLSVSGYIATVLSDALLRTPNAPDPVPFRLVTVGGNGPRTGVDLDRTSALLAAEDGERYGPR